MIPIKTRQEVEYMRAACRLASQILNEISSMLSPGMTTKEVDLAAARLMADAGCRSAFLGYKKFPGNICISLNDEVVHGIGSHRRIQYGDIVKLDIGVILNGFVGDTAATVPIAISLLHFYTPGISPEVSPVPPPPVSDGSTIEASGGL